MTTVLRRAFGLAVLMAAVSAVMAPAAFGSTFTVNKLADTADGTCDSDCSLREAIGAADANAGADNVVVPPGTYHLTIPGVNENSNATGDLDITGANAADTTVVGHSARDTIIDGTGLNARLFDVLTTGVGISHLTVTGASVAENGGGIRVTPSSSLTLTDAAVVGNIASGPSVGGGLDIEGGATINRSLIANNQNSGDGGGIDVDGSVSISDSTIANNRVDTTLAPANPGFGAFGGGMEVDGTATLTNVTIAGNFITDTTGAPLHGTGSAIWTPATGHVTAVNTIVYGNSGATVTSTANCEFAQTSNGHNVDQDGTCFSGGTGDTTSDPLLGTLADNGGETNTMAIGSSGSALDTGASGSCSTTDQRAVGRPQGSGCDIGAFELGGVFTVTKTADTADGTCDSDCSLREAITAANTAAGLNVVVLPAGHYVLDHTGAPEEANATGDLDVLGPLELRGAGARSTAVDGNATDRVFDVRGVAGASLDGSGLTIENGKLVNSGGGIHNGNSLTLTDAAVSGNAAGDGSACNSIGGGISNNGASLVLNRVAVTGNFANCDGAGIDIDGGAATITNTTIAGNTMPDTGPAGGGMDIETPSQVIFRNDTITNNTIPGNDPTSGAGLWLFGAVPVAFFNTIVAGNTTGGVPNDCTTSLSPVAVSAPNLDGDSSCFSGSGAMHSATPGLGALANNGGPTDTIGLLSGSPAIDAGLNVECPAVDQRSVARPVGSQCDVGAFEGTLSPSGPPSGPSANPPASAPPSNSFTLAKTIQNKKNGTATITVTVPGPGALALSGNGVVAQSAAARAIRSVSSAGTYTLVVRSSGKARRKLNSSGKVAVQVTVTFTPTGGAPRSQSEKVKLVKRRKR